MTMTTNSFVFLTALALGCGDTPEPAPTPAPAEPAVASVSPEGTRFDPPTTTSAIPDGSWMCDMSGSVHYAAGDKGDGSCPVCGMHLAHKGAKGKAGHDHGKMKAKTKTKMKMKMKGKGKTKGDDHAGHDH